MISAEATIKRKRPEAAAMSRWGHTKYFPRFPKSALHEFHQVHGGTPVFVIEDGPPPPASPKFTCHLTIPALATPHGGYEETSFTAVARAKKAAEHAAAEKALEFITTRGLLPPATPAMPPMPSSNVSLDEVRLLQQRLRTLNCQRAAFRDGPAAGNQNDLTAVNSSIAMEPEPEIDIASLNEDDLRKELIKAHEVNARLRKELQLEQERREAAVGALVGSS